jgi:hypothetical protein
MKSTTKDFERELAVRTNGQNRDEGRPGWSGSIEKPQVARGILMPQRAIGRPESKVTWQGFVNWMTARGA